MTQESIDEVDQTVATPMVLTNVVEVVEGQASESLRRIIPPNMTTVRTATFQTTENASTPKIVVQIDDGEPSF
jgi:hypothetical protein